MVGLGWEAGVFDEKENAGLLEVRSNGSTVTVSFQPGANFGGGSPHAAWLGFNLLSNVRAGENTGRLLRHDFVVLDHATALLGPETNGLWKTGLTSTADHGEAGAIARWIESNGVPIQATGGWLSGGPKK